MNKSLKKKLNKIKKDETIDQIKDGALPFLNEKKLDNFILSCKEKDDGILKVKSLPWLIILEPTNVCNLRCPLCPTGLELSERKKGIANIDHVKKFLYSVKDHCIQLHLQAWGEPTLHKKLCEIISYCKELGLYTYMSTNFSLNYKEGYIEKLVKSGLSHIHIDIDGMTQDVYSKYRKRGNLDVVFQNLEGLCKIKEKNNLEYPKIELAMLAMKQNEHQHQDFLKLKNKFKVDSLKIGNIQYNPNTISEYLPENKKYIYKSYESGNANTNSSTDKEIKKCNWPWSGFVVNYSGDISACCIVDDPNSDFGNVFEEGVAKIWNNKYYISSRAEFVDQNKIITNTICNICKNQTHSKNLNRLGSSFAIKK